MVAVVAIPAHHYGPHFLQCRLARPPRTNQDSNSPALLHPCSRLTIFAGNRMDLSEDSRMLQNGQRPSRTGRKTMTACGHCHTQAHMSAKCGSPFARPTPWRTSAVGSGKASKQREDYDRLRPLSYPATDVVLMCFSIDSPDSLENYMESEGLQVRHFCRSAPFVLGDEAPTGIGKASKQREDYDRLRPLSYPAPRRRPHVRHFCRSAPFVLGDEAPTGIGKARKQREDYDRLRPLSYPAPDVVLMCFSIDSPDSLENYMETEGLQVRHFCRSAPFVLGDEAPTGIGKARSSARTTTGCGHCRTRPPDVVLMCFSIDSPDSLENYMETEGLQVRHFCRSAPFVLGDEAPTGIGKARKQREDYDRLRPLSYPAPDVVLMCFSIDSPDSLENYMETEGLQVRHFCRSAPFVLGDEAPTGIGKARKQREDYDRLRPLSYPAPRRRPHVRHFCRSAPFVLGDEAPTGIGKARKQREDYDRLRPLSYPAPDVVLMCFSIDSPDSLENYMETEGLQVRHFCRSAPFVLGDEAPTGIGKARKQREDYDRLRPLSYPAPDVVLMCFSIDSPDSLENYMESEGLQVRHFCRSAPFVLGDEAPTSIGKARKQREDYDRLRPLSYPATDVDLICFSIDSPDSLENYMESEGLQLRRFNVSAPVLVGD
ncbi:hypothetical protein MTO96_013119 [Rhipicephalus appendiculatus]